MFPRRELPGDAGHSLPPSGRRPVCVGQGAAGSLSVLRRVLLLAGALAAAVAGVAAPAAARSAASQTWPPFALVAGLLLIGLVAHDDGVFDRAADVTGRIGGGGATLLVALLGLVAVVTVFLNLDTSVVFLTPVMVLAARRRGLDVTPFVFGSLFMANAASLLLPGSNLTNLIVLARVHVSGAVFAARMFPAWTAAVTVTTVVLLVRYRRELAGPAVVASPVCAGQGQPARAGRLGVVATVIAGTAVVVLSSPAIPVLALGLASVGLRLRQGRLGRESIAAQVDLFVLGGLFGVAVALGAVATTWSGPGDLMRSANEWESAVVGALGAVLVNNLPAAVMLSSRAPAHPRALLIGLDLGPNLAVTGSLSALLWYQAAKSVGVKPSALTVTRIGLVLVPLSMGAALAALALLAPSAG